MCFDAGSVATVVVAPQSNWLFVDQWPAMKEEKIVKHNTSPL